MNTVTLVFWLEELLIKYIPFRRFMVHLTRIRLPRQRNMLILRRRQSAWCNAVACGYFYAIAALYGIGAKRDI